MTLQILASIQALIMGHAVGDYALQSEAMAKGKCRHLQPDIIGARFNPSWQYWLLSHALIHGAIVATITANPWLGLAETVSHAAIDFLKAERKINIHVDQALHVVCKVAWALIDGGLIR